jgi:hypothetical protein
VTANYFLKTRSVRKLGVAEQNKMHRCPKDVGGYRVSLPRSPGSLFPREDGCRTPSDLVASRSLGRLPRDCLPMWWRVGYSCLGRRQRRWWWWCLHPSLNGFNPLQASICHRLQLVHGLFHPRHAHTVARRLIQQLFQQLFDPRSLLTNFLKLFHQLLLNLGWLLLLRRQIKNGVGSD